MWQWDDTKERGCEELADRAIRYSVMKLQRTGGNIKKLQWIGFKKVPSLKMLRVLPMFRTMFESLLAVCLPREQESLSS